MTFEKNTINYLGNYFSYLILGIESLDDVIELSSKMPRYFYFRYNSYDAFATVRLSKILNYFNYDLKYYVTTCIQGGGEYYLIDTENYNISIFKWKDELVNHTVIDNNSYVLYDIPIEILIDYLDINLNTIVC